MDAEPILFYTPDISNYTCRYNQFTLVESARGSTTGGINVPLKLVTGQYSYTVYETNILPSETIDLSTTNGRVVEEGRMVVQIEEEYNNEINNNTIGLTNSVYL